MLRISKHKQRLKSRKREKKNRGIYYKWSKETAIIRCRLGFPGLSMYMHT